MSDVDERNNSYFEGNGRDATLSGRSYSWYVSVSSPQFLDSRSPYYLDRRPALKSILTTMLFTYSSFLGSIVSPPPPPYAEEIPPDWHRLLEWMRVTGQNLIAAANDLRPIQVRLQGYMLNTLRTLIILVGQS